LEGCIIPWVEASVKKHFVRDDMRL